MGEIEYFIKTRIRNLFDLPLYFHYRKKHRTGLCSVCGRKSIFLASSDNAKESGHCIYCNAWQRLRFLSDQMIKVFSKEGSRSLAGLVREKDFSNMAIYEAQASGPIHNVLKRCPKYVSSEYLDNVEPGALYKGVRSEDLQKLSFRDATFDIVLHSSVLEHVRKPLLALKESYRVLKDGGYLIFEIPMTDPWSGTIRRASVQRVDVSSNRDIFILEPVYHDDPLRSRGSLVYTDFGLDIVSALKDTGFKVETAIMPLEGSSMSHVVSFICERKNALPER